MPAVSIDPELRPRDYASRIMALKTREARIAALNEVPEEWRELVRTYVEIAYARYWAGRRLEESQ